MKSQDKKSNEQKKEVPKQELPTEKEMAQNVALSTNFLQEEDDLEDEPLTSFQQITNGDFKRLMGCGG